MLISAVGWLWMDQRLDGWALLGLGMIVAGVLVINLMSKTVAH
jgi:small multidrug resistance pump